MKIGPKYKIARRLNAAIFEKTQTQKFSIRAEKKNKGYQTPKTDFGVQMNEKQKARLFYGITEKQFAKYVKLALTTKGSPVNNLVEILERRLDNVIWRSQFITTHSGARQATAHGHFLINGKRTYIPSYTTRSGDVIKIREGSKKSKLFSIIDERLNQTQTPSWMEIDIQKKEIKINDNKVMNENDNVLFDLSKVIEYYQR
jgi:small subunit ribosomal protein S4